MANNTTAVVREGIRQQIGQGPAHGAYGSFLQRNATQSSLRAKIKPAGRFSLGAVALSLLLSTFVSPAMAASDFVYVSGDGQALLSEQYDSNLGQTVYKYYSTATGGYITLDGPSGAVSYYANALSADGKTVVGTFSDGTSTKSVLWTQAGGYQVIPSTFSATYLSSVSADGTAAAGYANDNGTMVVVYWDAENGLQVIGSTGGSYVQNVVVSGDGKTVVVSAPDASSNTTAYFWSVDVPGFYTLNTGSLFDQYGATHVSYNGDVIAGFGTVSGYNHVFYFDDLDGVIDIGTLGGNSAYLRAMSDDGNYLAGYSGTSDGETHAYRYDHSTLSMQDLGTLGGAYSYAYEMTADGSVVVGTSRDANGDSRGFRWSTATDMITIEEWMASVGVTAGNYVIASANTISDDGNVVAGFTDSGEMYYARYAATAESGVITLDTFLPTVASAGSTAANRQLYSADTVMFGAQGQPMRSLLSPEQKAVWGTVDIGHDETDQASGTLALGEFGFGYGLSDTITGRLSLGVVNSDFDLSGGGTVDNSGFYISPEASIEMADDLYLTLGGFWSTAGVKTNRAYLNGGTTDYSAGSTNAQTWGAKVRLDWLDALVVNDTSFTPYVGLSYSNTSVDAYSETGGSFPVSYDGVDDHSTIARLGVDVVHNVTDDFRLLAKAEAAYQFEESSSSVSGAIIGLNSFTLSGQDHQQFWVRGGVGAEYDVAGGTASLMLNVTSNGQDPNVWVRSNFTVKF